MKNCKWYYIIILFIIVPLCIFSNANFKFESNKIDYSNESFHIFLDDNNETTEESEDEEKEDEDDEEKEENLDSLVNATLTKIDFSSLEELVTIVQDDYDFSFTKSFFSLIQSVVTGQKAYDFNDFIDIFYNAFLVEFRNILPMLISIVILAILFEMLQNMSDNLNNGSIKKIIFIAIWGVVLVIIAFLVSKSIITTKKTVDYFGKFIDIIFPILITIITALGGSYTVSIYQPLVLIFTQFIFKIIQLVILPLFYASFVFIIISGFSSENFLEKLSKTAKSVANWIMGIVFSLFITITTAQGITGASMDSLAVRGAKYALSSYVPVLGNYLSQGFDLVMASFVVVKNAVGLSAVLLVVFMAIFPIVKLLIVILGFKLVGAICEPLAGKKFSDLLTNTASCMMTLVIILVAIAFTMIIIFMLIIYSCNWGL